MSEDLTRLATETLEDHAVNAHPDDDLAQDTFDGRMRTREPLLAAGVLDLTRLLSEARAEIERLKWAALNQCDDTTLALQKLKLENYDLRRWADAPITSVEIYKGEAHRARKERDEARAALAELGESNAEQQLTEARAALSGLEAAAHRSRCDLLDCEQQLGVRTAEVEALRAARDAACDLAEQVYDGGSRYLFNENQTGTLRAVGAKP